VLFQLQDALARLAQDLVGLLLALEHARQHDRADHGAPCRDRQLLRRAVIADRRRSPVEIPFQALAHDRAHLLVGAADIAGERRDRAARSGAVAMGRAQIAVHDRLQGRRALGAAGRPGGGLALGERPLQRRSDQGRARREMTVEPAMGQLRRLHQLGDADAFQPALADLPRRVGDDALAALRLLRLRMSHAASRCQLDNLHVDHHLDCSE
jgi:hypothetical protein